MSKGNPVVMQCLKGEGESYLLIWDFFTKKYYKTSKNTIKLLFFLNRQLSRTVYSEITTMEAFEMR